MEPSLVTTRRFVIDGTNVVLIHGRGSPELRYLLGLGECLRGRGDAFTCCFDANMMYLLRGYDDQASLFARMLVDGWWSARVHTVPGGSEADEWILRRAKAEDADVISNDKYRDRARDYRWIWKRRHPVIGTRDALILETLGLRIPLRPAAADYF